MPAYLYRCHSCDASFSVNRAMADPVPERTPCPDGHVDTVRVFTPIAVVARGSGTSAGGGLPAAAPAGGGGACCGGGCCS
jgi:putative FmdB family regulatory protein